MLTRGQINGALKWAKVYKQNFNWTKCDQNLMDRLADEVKHINHKVYLLRKKK